MRSSTTNRPKPWAGPMCAPCKLTQTKGLHMPFEDILPALKPSQPWSPESKLVASVVLDAIRIVDTGDVRPLEGSRQTMAGKRIIYREYKNAVAWIFNDPDPGRVMGFEWCLSVISSVVGVEIDADALRCRLRPKREGRLFEQWMQQEAEDPEFNPLPNMIIGSSRDFALSKEMVRKVRGQFDSGKRIRDIATMYDLEYDRVRKIVAGVNYKGV